MSILPPITPDVTQHPPIIAIDMPVMYEDEGQEEMGEAIQHTTADHILSTGIAAHLRDRPRYRVFSNLDLHYHPIDRKAYVSPDVMVVVPGIELPEDLGSYQIGVDGPAPETAIEILSRRSYQQQDLSNKPDIYSQNGVAEYILFDPTQAAAFLPQRLILKRLQPDGTWVDEKDPDGGVTSRLGFRIIVEADKRPRVIDAATGKRYARPDEAQEEIDAAQATAAAAQATAAAAQATAAAAQATAVAAQADAEAARRRAEAEAEVRRQAEERLRQLQAELDRLRGSGPTQ